RGRGGRRGRGRAGVHVRRRGGGKDPARGSPERKGKKREGCNSNGAGLGSPSKVVEEGAKAYVDGTLFTDGGAALIPTLSFGTVGPSQPTQHFLLADRGAAATSGRRHAEQWCRPYHLPAPSRALHYKNISPTIDKPTLSFFIIPVLLQILVEGLLDVAGVLRRCRQGCLSTPSLLASYR
ncbi:hypothetical protein THAOC_01317, partial [Thalassiosira oceanica]